MINKRFFTFTIFILITMTRTGAAELDFDLLRSRMVEEQLLGRNVSDEGVINAMREVKRHLFVPRRYRAMAYQDTPLPIDEGQTISQPYIVGLMTQLLEVDKKDKVLEVGTGSGYQAAVLSLLADSVFTIEIICELANSARKHLDSLGYDNVVVKCGDGYKGWKKHAPFDGIIVTCAPEEIPPPLLNQLRTGGRMVIPVGAEFQELLLVEKDSSGTKRKSVIPVRFVPMTGEHQTEKE